MFSKEIIQEAQREFSKWSGKEISEGTAEIWLREIVEYFKVLEQIDRRIQAEKAAQQEVDEPSRGD